MAKKMKYPGRMQSEIKEIDYFRSLSKEDQEWMIKFQRGYYGNEHRKIDIFNEHPEYESRMKKELDDRINSINRCTTSELTMRGRMDSLDFLAGTKEESYISNLLFRTMSKKESEQMLINFGVKSFEESCTSLMTETAISIGNESINNEFVLLNFYLTINALIKEELREQRKEKKRLKELEA